MNCEKCVSCEDGECWFNPACPVKITQPEEDCDYYKEKEETE